MKILRNQSNVVARRNQVDLRSALGFVISLERLGDYLRNFQRTPQSMVSCVDVNEVFTKSFPTGIKYLTDKKLRWHEKFFWFVALSLSITVCSYLIYDSFRKWQMAPVIVSFSEKFLNIWEIPFAAVTICPTAGVSPLNENYTNNGIFSNALNDFPDAIDSAITNVTWRNSIVKASDMFTEIATDEGICYTFNMMNFDDVFADDV